MLHDTTDAKGTSPEDRALEAFSCLARLDRELAMLAVHAEAVDDARADALEDAIRAVNTARLCLRAATRDWLISDLVTPRQVRDAEKLVEASHYLDGVRDTDGGE